MRLIAVALALAVGAITVAVAVGTRAVAAPVGQAASTKQLHYRIGPIHIRPGQNTNTYALGSIPVPDVAGYITRFAPNLTYKDGTVPPVDVLHLHHAVWFVNNEPRWFAGEEKTVFQLPPGYGWVTKPGDRWIVNHMIHNLFPTSPEVYITWTIDFVPATSPAAKHLRPVQTLWLDTRGGEAYPVFDVLKGTGTQGRYTYPNQAPLAYTKSDPRPYRGSPVRNTMPIPADGTLVAAVGHLHPGGLWNDISLSRKGKRVQIFRSSAHYFEPAGPVSWDVALGVTRADWRVRVHAGDLLSVATTYDTRASWYESMGLAAVYISPGDRKGRDPFTSRIDRRERLTHGHLRENDHHGGKPGAYPDARELPGARAPDPLTQFVSPGAIEIKAFRYSAGDLASHGAALRPPTVPEGQSLAFINEDAAKDIFHTITACKAPCDGSTGIASPLADATVPFDSGELGFGPVGQTAAANTASWQTPKTLPTGTYTFFCRIHPFMRGSFRVVKPARPLG
jgi:plastocyanin